MPPVGCDDVDETFFGFVLPPVADHENEWFGDVELPQRIAEIDGRVILGSLGVHGNSAMVFVGRGGNVPLLRVAGRLVAVEKRVVHPGFKNEAVLLHLLRPRHRQSKQGAG